MTEKNILNYIDTVIVNLNKHLSDDGSKLNETERQKMEMRLDVVQEIKRAFGWGLLPEENKQGSRIIQLAKLREENVNVLDHLREINLYSKIREVIPYIWALNYKIGSEGKPLMEVLLHFCEKQLETIDSSPYKREFIFPTKQEVEEAFEIYTNQIRQNKIPVFKVYFQPEASQKIEELYQMFLELSA